MAIVDSVLQLVGATPLVRLQRIVPSGVAEIVVKLESVNPAGSVKDRIALAMIEAAERNGELKPGDTIVEPTSGNTGIGLALVAAVKGYKLIITMPDDSSEERRRLLAHYGAKVVLTPARKLMPGAIARAKDIVAQNPRCFMPQQFDNPNNPAIHRSTTAAEILDGTDSTLDAFVAGVGTGGTITGVGEIMKQKLPDVIIVAVEPDRSRALVGGKTQTHAIQGIGAGFVPSIVNRDVIDDILHCKDKDAFDMSALLAEKEGISAGVSGGAAVWGALQIAQRLGSGKRVVTLVPDGWERYVSMDKPSALDLDFII